MKSKLLLIGGCLYSTLLLAQIQSPPTPPTLENNNEQNGQLRQIDTHDLTNLIQIKAAPVTIIDARSKEADRSRQIPGAKLLPSDASNEMISNNLLNKDAIIVIYCEDDKCPEGRQLADRLIAMGYTDVLIYRDGLLGWESSGNVVEIIKKDPTRM